jgi:hypothetical protein
MSGDMKAVEALPEPIYNPWCEFIENVINGDNYFRAQEYRDLIEDLDSLYLDRSTLAAAQAKAKAMEAGLNDVRSIIEHTPAFNSLEAYREAIVFTIDEALGKSPVDPLKGGRHGAQ